MSESTDNPTLDVEALTALLADVPDAPWRVSPSLPSPSVRTEGGTELVFATWRDSGPAVLKLIATMRNQLPALLAKLDETERERDMLGRQQQAILDACEQAAAYGYSTLPIDRIQGELITDPADSNEPLYEDYSWSADASKGEAELTGDGDRPIYRLDKYRLVEFIAMAQDTLHFLEENATPTAAPKATVTLPALPSCTRGCPGVICDHPEACPLDAGGGEPYHQPCGCLTNDGGAHRGACPVWETREDARGRFWVRRVASSGESTDGEVAAP